jgi:AcrR family transcriptional regulator
VPRGIAKDHDEKRTALQSGAARYFAAHGFDRASMSGAARACGVSKALLYHYHDSKEALLYDILDAHLSHLLDTAHAAAPAGLNALIAAILDAYQDADAAHKLQLEALPLLPQDLRAPLVMLQRELVTLMSGVIALRRPDLPADRLRAATMTVFGILNWLYMWHRPNKGMSRKEYALFAADFVEGGLAQV